MRGFVRMFRCACACACACTCVRACVGVGLMMLHWVGFLLVCMRRCLLPLAAVCGVFALRVATCQPGYAHGAGKKNHFFV